MAKLTNEQKIEIYERRLKGESLKSLSYNFNISIHNPSNFSNKFFWQ